MGTQVAHKHGWTTYFGVMTSLGDAGIVYTQVEITSWSYLPTNQLNYLGSYFGKWYQTYQRRLQLFQLFCHCPIMRIILVKDILGGKRRPHTSR